jgi:small subunit ribosomal protein S17
MATKKAKQVKAAKKADTVSASDAPRISLRGKTLMGTVTSAKATQTVTVMWERRQYVPKYERYERRQSKVQAHNPDAIGAQEGDVVRIKECRPLSKTKHFVVTEIIKRTEQ